MGRVMFRNLLPGTGSVDLGRLVEGERNSLEPGEEDDGDRARAQLGDHHQSQLGGGGVTQPVDRRDPEQPEELVEDPPHRVEHGDEDEGGSATDGRYDGMTSDDRYTPTSRSGRFMARASTIATTTPMGTASTV